MSKNLVIVESPAKAKTIEKFLGGDFKVVSSNGHIADLPSNELGIDLESRAFVMLIIIPSIISVLALNVGGYLADKMIKSGVRVIKVRKIVNSIGFFGSAICLFMVPLFE